jgi:DNA polymerase-4
MTEINNTIRKIIHVDMDAFYASVEQRDNPGLKGKPVIVGGPPNSRGVVATCSYEARKYGIHSAMASRVAFRLCPQAIFITPRFEVYEKVSEQVLEIFHEYTDLVEPLSLDEAYLDVTENKKGIPLAAEAARLILKEIYARTGLTASAGVSFNKFLAKVAANVKKPHGLTVVTPKKAAAKVKYYNFQGITRSITVPEPIDEAGLMMKYVSALLDKTEAGKLKVRLLGISLSNLT